MTTINLEALLADLGRFPRVTNEIDDAAHSKISESLFNAAKDILPLLPDGPAVESVLASIKRAALDAHAALTVHEKSVSDTKAILIAAGSLPTVPEVHPPTLLERLEEDAKELLGIGEPEPAPTAEAPAPA